MQQDNLWATRARCTGINFTYHAIFDTSGVAGRLTIAPIWSKRTTPDGHVVLDLDECEVDVVPELFRQAWEGVNSTDPGYYVPRWVKQKLKDYENASHY